MANEDRLARYRELLAKVDAKFTEIATAKAAHMQCRAGCFSCCKPGLTVSSVEWAALRALLAADPERRARIAKNQRVRPQGADHCSLLDEAGRCLVYEARPIVCRSHGVPLKVTVDFDADEAVRDVCPLNFTEVDLRSIDSHYVLNTDLINTLLALINAEWSPDDSLARFELDHLAEASD